MRRPDNSPQDWTYLAVEQIPDKSPEFVFLYYGHAFIDGVMHEVEGRYECPKDCRGIYLRPDKQRGARALVIYTN